jgi:hypothetical protein
MVGPPGMMTFKEWYGLSDGSGRLVVSCPVFRFMMRTVCVKKGFQFPSIIAWIFSVRSEKAHDSDSLTKENNGSGSSFYYE